MSERQKLHKSDLRGALNALSSEYRVFAPTGKAERQAFTLLEEKNIDDINLEGAPVLPPKELMFPRSETLFSIELGTNSVSQPGVPERSVLFGARPCDARSIDNLDSAFLDKEYTDSAYAAKRDSFSIISLACAGIPYRTCFCDGVGGGPYDETGSDVLLTETKDGDAWLLTIITEKGRAIEDIWQTAGLLRDAGKTSAVKKPECELKIAKDAGLSEKLKAAFEDEAWARFSEACIGCGTCSYICPTCYCFDIDMEVSGTEASEFRCWDCCMFSDYSRMAGGHNPRPTKKERLRNRYLHKLAYFDERYGKTLCVGCGRCISKCPAGLDIASVIEWGGTL